MAEEIDFHDSPEDRGRPDGAFALIVDEYHHGDIRLVRIAFHAISGKPGVRFDRAALRRTGLCGGDDAEVAQRVVGCPAWILSHLAHGILDDCQIFRLDGQGAVGLRAEDADRISR